MTRRPLPPNPLRMVFKEQVPREGPRGRRALCRGRVDEQASGPAPCQRENRKGRLFFLTDTPVTRAPCGRPFRRGARPSTCAPHGSRGKNRKKRLFDRMVIFPPKTVFFRRHFPPRRHLYGVHPPPIRRGGGHHRGRIHGHWDGADGSRGRWEHPMPGNPVGDRWRIDGDSCGSPVP
jgi:hypothetical protein